jgi:hypothetical protein
MKGGQIFYRPVLAEGEGVVLAEFDPVRQADMCARLPALAHWRL